MDLNSAAAQSGVAPQYPGVHDSIEEEAEENDGQVQPSQVRSQLQRPTPVTHREQLEHVRGDVVEGTKDFNDAYDKLVKKFYNEEGANLLIPADDMIVHEYNENYKAKVDVNERQRKIEE